MMDSLAGRLSTLAENRPSEMIYLQTSKGVYETGEDLWFKAYVLDAHTLALSGRSETLYVQVVNENGNSVVWQEKYPIKNGVVAGHVYVNDSLRDGNYSLEACTRHSFYADSTEMSNVRRVKIVQNINKSEKNSISAKDSTFRFEMFPESGILIAGIPCRLAFKATAGQGYPMNIKGVLYQDGDSLQAFRSVHAGMGCMEFTPKTDRMYQIRLSTGETYSLPEIHPLGMTFRLSGQASSQMEFVVSQQGEQSRIFYLAGRYAAWPGVCCATV
jgi:hypothetical protein